MNPTEMLQKMRASRNEKYQEAKTRAGNNFEFLAKLVEGLKQVQPQMKFRRNRLFGSVVEPFVIKEFSRGESGPGVQIRFGNHSITCEFSSLGHFGIFPDQVMLAMDSLFMGEIAHSLINVRFASEAVEIVLRILVKYEVEG